MDKRAFAIAGLLVSLCGCELPEGPAEFVTLELHGDEPPTLSAARRAALGEESLTFGSPAPCPNGALTLTTTTTSPASTLCVTGLGAATLPPTWANKVTSFTPGPNAGFLGQSSCGVSCWSQQFAANSGSTSADLHAGQYDLVAVYSLRPLPSPPPGAVRQFLVGDSANAYFDGDYAMAKKADYIYGGDRHPHEWATQSGTTADPNRKMWVGHYMQMNEIGEGVYPHCNDSSDCTSVDPALSCQTLTRPVYPFPYLSASPSPPPELICAPTPCQCLDGPCADCPSGSTCKSLSCTITPPTSDWQYEIDFNHWRCLHPEWILYKCPPSGQTQDQADAWAADYKNVAWAGYLGGQHNSNLVPLDFTNSAVFDAMNAQVKPLWSDGLGYSTLSMDIVFLTNTYQACGVFPNATPSCGGSAGGAGTFHRMFGLSHDQNPDWPGQPDPNFDPLVNSDSRFDCSGHEGYCDWEYTSAVLTWLQRWRDELHKSSISLVINMGSLGNNQAMIPNTNPTLRQVFQAVDGVLTEDGFTHGGQASPAPSVSPACVGGQYASWSFDGVQPCALRDDNNLHYTDVMSEWSYRVGYMEYLQTLSKPYFDKTEFPFAPVTDQYYTTTDITFPASSPTPAPKPEAQPNEIDWVLATHLLANAASASMYVEQPEPTANHPEGSGDSGYNLNYRQLDVSVGSPCEPRVQNGNQYSRSYSRAFVLANAGPAGATATVNVKLPGGHTFTRYNNAAVAINHNSPCQVWESCISLAPQSAMVLYSSGLLCCNLAGDCPSGQLCDVNHLCTTSCSTTAPCSSGCCNHGQCVSGTSNAACGQGGLCRPCLNSSCQPDGSCLRCSPANTCF